MPFDNETTTIFADDNDNDNNRHNHSNSLNHKHNHHTFRSLSSTTTTTTQPKMIMKIKRKKNSEKREQLPSEEICETKEKWEQVCPIIYEQDEKNIRIRITFFFFPEKKNIFR